MTHKLALILVLVVVSVSPAFAQGGTGPDQGELPLPVGGIVFNLQPEVIQAMQAAHMTWISHWIGLNANTDLAAIRDFIDQSHQAGFKVLLNVIGDVEQLAALGEAYYPIFAASLEEIAALSPDAIQVWREMNLAGNWPQGQIDPAAYVALLGMAYDAIKAVNPDILVITGALKPTGSFGATDCTDMGCNDDVYAQQMAEAGAADFADCIGVMYIEGIVSPAQTSGDPRDDYATRYFPTMIERAAAPFAGEDIPLCFTGLGYLSAEGYETTWPDYLAFARNTSVTQQAKWLRDAVLIARDDGRVALIIVQYIDNVSTNGDFSSGMAIIRADGTCPACQAIGSLAHLPNPEPSASLTLDEELTAAIDQVTPAAAFTVQPGDQEHISVRVDPTDGSTLDPVLIIYDSAGNLIAFNDDISSSSLSARIDQLPGNQELKAVVYAFNEGSTGDFILRVNSNESLTGSIVGNSNANIRSGPSTNASIVTTAAPGTEIQIRGRNADASWLAITVDGVEGWIASFLVSSSDDVSGLPVLE
ncbi:MAG: hypothetical protein Kow0077_22530 [Anaerolineae bacterium]